jgi:para-aminobenzoate synthetase component 1
LLLLPVIIVASFIFNAMSWIRDWAIQQMNRFGKEGRPFVFLVDFEENEPVVLPLEEAWQDILWSFPESKNFKEIQAVELTRWEISPVDFSCYRKGFDLVQSHIHRGDSFLLNYTRPTPVKTNLSLEELFHLSRASYKVLLKDRFACFSPETFVTIQDGKISSFPMKGTIDASIPGAEKKLRDNPKERAEHHTIVDLIRNDLSRVAENVVVEKFMYLERIETNQGPLLQASSMISGILRENYRSHLGDILFSMLPAGSVSGAPKHKTIEIIREVEGQPRGFYTGIFGIFDGENLDSCVLIRFIENQNGQLSFRSGGGITNQSKAEDEYNEMIAKVYVPVD